MRVPVLILAMAVALTGLSAPFTDAVAKSGVTVVRGGSHPSVRQEAAPRRNSWMTDCEAAEAGDAGAAYRIARRFLFGVGVRRDKRVGTAWLRVAASHGNAEARRLVHYVPGRLGHFRPWCRPGAGPVRAMMPPPPEVVALVRKLAPDYHIDPALVLAVIQVESAFRPDAVSPKDAAGLMQLIPDTAERFGVADVFDPAQNVRGGIKYLRWLLAYFQGDVTLALAGYNAGERAVDRYKGVPPYDETRSYVRAVHSLYAAARHPFDTGVTDPSPLILQQEAELVRTAKRPAKRN